MPLTRLNAIAAIVALVGAAALLAFDQAFAGLIWTVAALFWLGRAVAQVDHDRHEVRPGARLIRWFSRLLIWS